MADKLYKVTNRGHVHVVQAATKAAALNFIARQSIDCDLLSALEAARLIESGKEIEDARGPKQKLDLETEVAE